MRMLRAVVSRGNKMHGVRPCRWLPRTECYWYVWRGYWRFRLTRLPNVGIWLSSGELRDALCITKTLQSFERVKPVIRKRDASKAAGDAAHLAPMESVRLNDCLSLIEHCAVRKYDDGTTRDLGYFTVKVQGAGWCVQVKDPDTCCSFQVLGKTVDEALESAALMLSCDEAPWEPDTWLSQQKARRKK